MDRLGSRLLAIGGVLNLGMALLHLCIIAIGPAAYLYFGRADLAQLAAAGSPLPASVTAGLVVIFSGFSLYGLSGAGRLGRLPLLRAGLIGVGALYTLRGLIVVLDLLGLALGQGYPVRQTLFSAAALATGLLFLVGTARQWRWLAGRS
jgi:hypothetical protein